MFLLNNQSLQIDTAFSHNGVNYPQNWLRLATPQERAAIGITEAPEPAWYDAAVSVNRGANGNSTWSISHRKLEKLGIHASETAWVGTQFDAVLDNNGTLDDLYQQVKALATSPAQDHPGAK